MSSSRCTQGAIRLANKTETSTLLKGRLEVCDDGEWKAVCYSGYWPTGHSEFICKHLLGRLPQGMLYVCYFGFMLLRCNFVIDFRPMKNIIQDRLNTCNILMVLQV